MEVTIQEMIPGDSITFECHDFWAKTLSGWLGLVESNWRNRLYKPWHLAVASKKVTQNGEDGWLLIEAVAPCVAERFHSLESLQSNCRAYRWLDSEPSQQEIERFKNVYLGFPYDITAYIGIIFSYMCRKWFHFKWRVVDTEHLCWETNAVFMRFMGKPYQPEWEYPMIHTIMEKLEPY